MSPGPRAADAEHPALADTVSDGPRPVHDAAIDPAADAAGIAEGDPPADGAVAAATTDGGNVADGAVDGWELVRRTQAGDSAAFGLIYDRYVEMVYRFVYYRLGDRGEAEDLTSETFLRALRRISTVHEQGHDVGAWLVTIARNLVLDHVKSAHYRLSVPTEVMVETATGDTTPGAALAAFDQRALLEAVRRLSPEQQESIVLRFFQGLSLAETAEVMGRNSGAVKALQHRAVRRLQSILAEPLEQPSARAGTTAGATSAAPPRGRAPPAVM